MTNYGKLAKSRLGKFPAYVIISLFITSSLFSGIPQVEAEENRPVIDKDIWTDYGPFSPDDVWPMTGYFTFHEIINLQVSSYQVQQGDTLTVTCTISWVRADGKVNWFQDAWIALDWGDAEVVSVDPPLNSLVSKNRIYGPLVFWGKSPPPGVIAHIGFDSPTTFKVTFKLGARNSGVNPCVKAGGPTRSYEPAIINLNARASDRISGKVYDEQTNFPRSITIRETPMPNIKVGLYTLPDNKLVAENVTQTDGSYTIKPENFDPKKTYLLQAKTETDGREIKQEIKVNKLTEVDIYLPKGLVHQYIDLVQGLDKIELPLISDVDLVEGLGYGGPFKETSLYGPIAELAKLGVDIDEGDGVGIRKNLEAYLDKILIDSPVCLSLRGALVPGDPWSNFLRLTMVMGFIKNRVPDAYVSIDNMVKGLTIAVMTNLMLNSIKSAGVGWQTAVDKRTPEVVKNAQTWLLDKATKNMMRIANTIHVTIFSGAFGLQGVDWLLTQAGVTNPHDKAVYKTWLAKIIRFGITDFIRKNLGTSIVFEVLFQGSRLIGDTALLQGYLWISRNQLSEALKLAEDGQAAGQNLEAMNVVGILDTQHDGWHKTQHTWARSWFLAANIFRGVGGIWAFWTKAPVPGPAYPFIAGGVQPLIQKVMTLGGPYLKAAGIGSFAGVVATETRALFATWQVQERAVNASFGILPSGNEQVSWSSNQVGVDAIQVRSIISSGLYVSDVTMRFAASVDRSTESSVLRLEPNIDKSPEVW